MFEETKYDRRRFIGTASMTIAAAQLRMIPNAAVASTQVSSSSSNSSFGTLKQIEAGLLMLDMWKLVGIGHNLPQEAPQSFAEAVIEADGY